MREVETIAVEAINLVEFIGETVGHLKALREEACELPDAARRELACILSTRISSQFALEGGEDLTVVLDAVLSPDRKGDYTVAMESCMRFVAVLKARKFL